MKNVFIKISLFCALLTLVLGAEAWIGMAVPRLHVDGRQLKDPQGNVVLLHGFAQTYSPWFNERGAYWTNYNVSGCLSYNKGLIDKILSAGWKMNFVRMHMDPYWSNTPGKSTTGEEDISAFSFDRFKTYLASVFIPMAQYAASKGLYVVMRPPGVCPKNIAVGDDYQKYLLKVWGYVAQQSKLKNNPAIMYELANEPVNILKADGTSGSAQDLHNYFQSITDTIRHYCSNIVWVPGTGWQSQYQGYAECPIEGDNVGYAVHVYPGWFNSGSGYNAFQSGWNSQVKPVANFAPIMVTEMDWAPEKYNSSWGKDSTGVAGGVGFGANFQKIVDNSGNVSWLLFTGPELLAKFKDEAPAAGAAYTFLTDPQACPWPCYHWFLEYAKTKYPRPDFSCLSSSDNGNGTYTNPIIQADFPDPDVKRVGDTYYMVTTTMHNFPGCTLLKSKDMVNWEYCCNPLQRLSSNAEYNLENNMNIYSKGSWATSLMYRNGTYYILFNTFGRGDDAGGYLLSATDPEGTWTLTHLGRGYYDPGLLYDDDGKTYVVCGNGNLSVIQLDANFMPVKEVQVVSNFSGLEGSHFTKKDGYYYIYSTCCAWPATQWCYRSTSPFGPYEQKEVFNTDDIHQGSLIQTQTGEWWTMLMRDCGAFGRMPYLEPVTWTDNWPVIGSAGKDVGTHAKPKVGCEYDRTYLPTNDNFRSYSLGPQWQWNHNPDNSRWSLFERSGYLRLYTASVTDSFQQARNTLTQRIYGYRSTTKPSYGTVAMDISQMAEGDVAGLCVFQDPYGYIGVTRQGGQFYIVQRNTDTRKNYQQAIQADSVVYLRAVANIGTSKASFYYSLDNNTYTKLGEDLSMQYKLTIFVGNRFCIFNYATKALGGRVDVDWFTTEPNFTEDTYYDNSFTPYSAASLTVDTIYCNRAAYSVMPGASNSLTLTARYLDRHTADVTTYATYSFSQDNIAKMVNGRIVGVTPGDVTLTATYKDPLGHVKSLQVPVSVSYFPLTSDVFNPSIFGTGTFNEKTLVLRTSQYGFGGWKYSNGIDFSAYNYLVVNLAAQQSCSASFRIFDENSYWSTPFMVDFGSSTKLAVNLQTMKKNNSTTKCDASHIYIVGFWTTGSSDVKIKSVYLSNDGVNPATGIVPIYDSELGIQNSEFVDVYSIGGICVRKRVERSEALKNLPRGLYIVDHRVVNVK